MFIPVMPVNAALIKRTQEAMKNLNEMDEKRKKKAEKNSEKEVDKR